MSEEKIERVRALAKFFEAFGPVKVPSFTDGLCPCGSQVSPRHVRQGGLSGEPLWRMHLSLKEGGHTSKTRHVFMTDVDAEGEGRVTLYKLHRTIA